jgi:branched-chain amino acid aminotransferase
MTTDPALSITPTSQSRINEVDLSDPGFGRIFSDHMLEVEYSNGQWQSPEIKPYGPIEITPALNALHYAQSVFEGTKAYYVDDETINLFRLEKNYERLVQSCQRMCIPEISKEIFIDGIRELVKLDYQWVPKEGDNTLYIRPMVCAFDPVIAARVSETYRLFVITSPVGAYYGEPVRLTTSPKHARAVKGGVGSAKAAGNYAASYYPAQKAKEKGFDQVLWLDAFERKYVEEVGTMNIFFVLDGTLVTPKLQGTILPGITRDSVLQIAHQWDLPVEERNISIEEVLNAGDEGVLEEVFGAGTAAVISPVKEVHHKGRRVKVHDKERGPIGQRLYEEITGIQRGKLEDPFGWVTTLKVD